jgi:TolB-like protein
VENLFSELKRRNVVRVGIAYIVLGWVVLQVGDILFDMFGTPDWVGKTLAALLLLGFPFACLFAWAFEMTPEGVKKTAEVDRSDSITHSTGRRLDFVIIAALVIALGYFIWERQDLAEPSESFETLVDKSIAVLPFVNMSSDQEQEWFADGLTEEILNSLARTPDLLVASRTSSFQYKGQNTDISAIAAALGVAHILEGSVRRGGDRLRVTAQLIRASDGFHLWSETFDREPKDVIEIQENVAFEIANALKTAMDPDALARMVSSGTASVAAYEAYLEGLALEGRTGATGNVEDWDRAVEKFERANELDPGFAKAHWHRAIYWASYLGITDINSVILNLSREERLQLYLEAAQAAIDTEEDEKLALKYRADMAQNQLRLIEAREYGTEYVRAYPNDIEGLSTLIDSMGWMRDTEGARKHLAQVLEVTHDDPLELNSLVNNLLFVGLVDEAVALARDVTKRYPQHAFLLYQAHRAFLWAGLNDDGRRLAEVLRRSEFPDENIQLVDLRQACAEKRVADAREFFDDSMASQREDPSTKYIALQVMGRPDEAHQLLVDSDLDVYALASFLNYPYFNHTYFPELAAILERQRIDRPFVSGPPYACAANQS